MRDDVKGDSVLVNGISAGDIGDTKKVRRQEIKKGLISFAIFIGCQVVFSLLWLLVLQDLFSANETVGVSIVNYTNSFVLLLVFLILYFKTLKADVKRLTGKNIIFIAIMVVVDKGLEALFSILTNLIQGNVAANQQQNEAMMATYIIPTVLMVLIYGPIVEELVFRKALNLVITNKAVFIVLSAILFGFIHSSGSIDFAVIGYIVSGLIYAIVYLKTDRNIAASILVHFLSNLVASIFILI